LSDLKKNCPISNKFEKNTTKIGKIGTETNRNGKTETKQRKYTINLCPISKKVGGNLSVCDRIHCPISPKLPKNRWTMKSDLKTRRRPISKTLKKGTKGEKELAKINSRKNSIYKSVGTLVRLLWSAGLTVSGGVSAFPRAIHNIKPDEVCRSHPPPLPS